MSRLRRFSRWWDRQELDVKILGAAILVPVIAIPLNAAAALAVVLIEHIIRSL